MSLTKASLRKLRKRLPKGYRLEAQKRLGAKYSLQLITMVASGSRDNEEVLGVLITLAEERAASAKGLASRIHQLQG